MSDSLDAGDKFTFSSSWKILLKKWWLERWLKQTTKLHKRLCHFICGFNALHNSKNAFCRLNFLKALGTHNRWSEILCFYFTQTEATFLSFFILKFLHLGTVLRTIIYLSHAFQTKSWVVPTSFLPSFLMANFLPPDGKCLPSAYQKQSRPRAIGRPECVQEGWQPLYRLSLLHSS